MGVAWASVELNQRMKYTGLAAVLDLGSRNRPSPKNEKKLPITYPYYNITPTNNAIGHRSMDQTKGPNLGGI